ncbi:MAG: hypothetical protein R3B06_04110 [Kofleriaceae bacterium]
MRFASLRLASGPATLASFVLVLVAATLSPACGGDDSGDGDPDAGPACTAIDDQLIATDATVLDAIVVDGDEVVLLATGGGAALYRRGQLTPLAVAATSGSLAVDGAGELNVIVRADSERKTYHARTPALALVGTGLDADLARPHLVHASRLCATAAGGCVPDDDLLLLFEGGFSSASAAHFTGGAWAEEELYLSSVSWTEDAATLDGQAIACVRYSGSAVLLTNHPYRGELDDVTGWAASGPGCAIAARSREVAMVFGTSPPRLAQWTLPLLPDAPWPTPPAAVDLALPLTGGYDLAVEDDRLVLAFADAGTLRLVEQRDSGWTDLPAPALALGGAPRLLVDATARRIIAQAADRQVHLIRQCR